MNITNRKGTWCPMWLGKTVFSYSVYSVHSKLMCELYQIIRIWIASHFHLIGRESESERARDSALGKIRLIKKNYLRAYYVSALAENIWLIREKREETRNDRDRDRKNSMHISRNMIYLNICHKKRGTNYNAHAFERLMMWCWFYFKCSSIIFAEWLLFTSDIIVHRI